jgi:fructokinase
MRIGIDFGGTKTEIICLDENNGKELYLHRVPTPKNDYAATVQTIAGLVRQAEIMLGKKGTLGIGIPGVVSVDTGLVKNANATWIIGKPFQKDIAAALEREVRMENDANCFTVSEATDGAGAGKNVVFGVIVGTGCGGGITIAGKPLAGINSICGEWGHNPLPYPVVKGVFEAGYFEEAATEDRMKESYYTQDKHVSEYPGPLCYCGRRGCVETWISGTGFKADYHRVTGEPLSTHDIISAAAKGEAKAVAALHRYAERMAKSLAQVVNILDPDVVVLGGGMSNVEALYTLVPQRWRKYIFSDSVKTQILQAKHGDSSGVRGAAWLWGR